MIRINLLPRKRRTEQQTSAGQGWLVVVLVAMLAEVFGLFALHSYGEKGLKAQNVQRAG